MRARDPDPHLPAVAILRTIGLSVRPRRAEALFPISGVFNAMSGVFGALLCPPCESQLTPYFITPQVLDKFFNSENEFFDSPLFFPPGEA